MSHLFRPRALQVSAVRGSECSRTARRGRPRPAGIPRRLGLALVLLLALGFAPGASVAAAEGESGPRARVVSEGVGGLTLRITVPEPVRTEVVLDGRRYLEVRIPGFSPGSDAAPGSPDLPLRGFPFGLPDEVTARIVRTRVLASTPFNGPPPAPAPERRVVPGDPLPTQEYLFAEDPDAYASGRRLPEEIVALGPVLGLRHQRVQSLVLRPVQVVASTGAYEAVREIEVEIRFAPEPGAPGRPSRAPVRSDDPGWEEMIDRLVVNPQSARSFRSRVRPAALVPQVGPGDVYVRVRVGGAGLCRIPFATLEAAGWPAGTAVSDVRVEERGYDKYLANPFTVTNLPRRVEDTNQNAVFDAGDFVLFYGLDYQNRFKPPIADARYSYYHTYWITPSAGPGVDLAAVDGYPEGVYTELVSFPETRTFEQNLVYINNPKDSGSSIFPIYDALYWLRTDQKSADLTFPVSDLAPGGMFRVRARWQGVNTVLATRTHIVSLDLNGQVLLDEGPASTFYDLNPFLWEGASQPSLGMLAEGTNTLRVMARAESPSTSSSGCLFDWYEVTYDRRLVAAGDRLAFNTGTAAGAVEMAITGFSSPDILIFDVTDPAGPFALTPLVEDAGGSYTARIRVTVAGSRRAYVATVPGSVVGIPTAEHALSPDLGTAAVARGLPRDLLVEGEGSDYILITHPDFRDAWQPLVDYREGQGHRVFLCDVWEIYDQFAGGDKTPWAIQRFLLQAFRTWDAAPSMVLLGGDASEDYRKDTDRSDPDWVPTLMHFAAVPGVAGLELSGTDTWYAAFLREGDPEWDVLPEMQVSRVPAGTTAEIQDYVQKVIDYEAMAPTDDWRRRGMFLADDRYSSGILQSTSYCYVNGEGVFKNTTLAMVDSIRVKAGLGGFRADTLFLASWLDTVDVLNRNAGTTPDCPGTLIQTRNYTRGNVTPALQDSLSGGYLLWEFTGHANKNTLCHEGLIDHRASSPRDLDRINNFGKPFLFMGYACHIMEFEGARENEVGQSMGEELLLGRNRGAIGVMASTAYEWLHTNPLAQIYTTRPLFWNLPRDASGRPRRLWGEAMTRGMVALITENPRSDVLPMIRTYQTFGDPALRVDVWPSAVSAVTVDGNPWSEGTALTAASFRDTVTVEAVVSDDVDVSSIRVLEAGVEMPSGSWSVTPPDSGTEGAQPYQVRFRTTLRLGTYDITLEARDWAGRASSTTFPVRFLTAFDSDGQALNPTGNVLEDGDPIGISVTSPVALAPENLKVFLDGLELAGVTPQGGPSEWRLDVVGIPFGEGDHRIELRVSHPDASCFPGACPLTRGVDFSTPGSTAELSIGHTYFYPNPAEGTEGQFLYELNRSGRSAQVTIYSLSGRRLLRTSAPARPGLNSLTWDLRDEAGDRVANGVYLLMIRVEGDDGVVKTTTWPERIVVAR